MSARACARACARARARARARVRVRVGREALCFGHGLRYLVVGPWGGVCMMALVPVVGVAIGGAIGMVWGLWSLTFPKLFIITSQPRSSVRGPARVAAPAEVQISRFRAR